MLALRSILRPSRIVYAHCAISCGIYDPELARVVGDDLTGQHRMGRVPSRRRPAALWLTLLAAALIVAAAAATPALTLPLGVMIMAVLVALLLTYHLTAARWATRQPER